MRSPSETPLVCIGHSHVRCVEEAATDQGVPLVAIDFWRFKGAVVGDGAARRFRDDIAQRLVGPVFSLIGGNAHHRVGLVVHPRRFDFVLPSCPDLPLDERAELVPFAGVKAAVLEVAREYLELMQILLATTSGPLFHLEPPPVYADEARIAPDVPWMYFQGRRRVSPRHLRYKLWRLHCDMLREFCTENGIRYLAHPPDAVDEQGFLRPELYANAMHVNGRYGALVLAQMRSAA
jgi:hypothetical protein